MTIAASPWTDQKDADLARLWKQDAPRLSSAQIAQLLGVTKNSLVGRAHRLAKKGLLVLREPAIRTAGAGQLRAARQAVSRDSQKMAVAPRLVPSAPRAVLPKAPAAPLSFAVRTASPHRRCQWITGEPSGAQSLFCGAATAGRSSYCAEHYRRCHADRQDMAA